MAVHEGMRRFPPATRHFLHRSGQPGARGGQPAVQGGSRQYHWRTSADSRGQPSLAQAQTMNNLDPTTAGDLDDLVVCLKHVHIRADRPTYRALEQQTIHANGLLPGTRLKRVRLTRSILSDVLIGRKFPGKAFLLTFVDACGIDLENDRRWEQAWDRLAVQYQQVSPPGEVERLRQENEELRQQVSPPGEVERLRQENKELRQQLAAQLRERLAPEVRLPGHPAARSEPGLEEDEAAKVPGIYIPSQETTNVSLLGRIAADGPVVAEESIEDIIPLPRQLVGEGTLFMLQVVGDSMIGAAILDGDRVVIRQQPIAQNGEIVAAYIDGEVTLKTFKQSDGHIWLTPQNPAYMAIPGDEAKILGRVVTVLRRV
jgi:SOS regulatory protein LexA